MLVPGKNPQLSGTYGFVGLVLAECFEGGEGKAHAAHRGNAGIPLALPQRLSSRLIKDFPMLRAALLLCSGLLVVAGCEREGEVPTATPTENAAAAEPALAADAGRKFFGEEKFTIVMQQTGRETGTVTLHYRDWGRRSAEFTKLTNATSGKVTDTRSFADGAISVTIDNVTGKVEVFENPYYKTAPSETEPKAADQFGSSAMQEMGAEKTTDSATIAGQPCNYWLVLGARKCVAAWGATLHSVMGMGDSLADRKATEVRLGDGGPDSAFVYVPPTEAQAPATAPQ